MEIKDKKPNIIAIIGAVILLVLAVIGLSYAFFSAFIKGSETDTSIEGTGAKLSLIYTDGKSVITSSNIMPGWSATKTFTVTNNGEGTAYYKLNISNITNDFVSGGLTFSITSNDGGATIAEMPVGTENRTISDTITIEVSKTHSYTITAKYINLDTDQTPDLGKSFSYTIGIEASKEPTLTETILANNEVKTPLTTPGAEVSAYKESDVTTTSSSSVSSTYQSYYVTYGTGWEANGTKFNLTGTAVTTSTYANSYASLVGKYLPYISLINSGSSTAGTKRTTTNLSSVYYVVSATSSSFTYKRISSNKNTTEALLASAEDDYGTSYYFRGTVTNNYVEFANKCWRIVRIGGDNTVKLILHNDNTTNTSNPCSSANNSTTAAFAHYNGSTYTSKFNTSYNDNAYVGFMYGTAGSSTYEATHANTNKSTILTNLETWYNNNLKIYENVIDDNVFCNDKNMSSGLGYGTNETDYMAYERLNTNKTPSLKCNGELSKITSKIGLITADELVYAGYAAYTQDSTSYLQENATDVAWWSLSPHGFNGDFASVWNVNGDSGYLGHNFVNFADGVRTYISLKPSAKVPSGSGTSEDPYVVK